MVKYIARRTNNNHPTLVRYEVVDTTEGRVVAGGFRSQHDADDDAFARNRNGSILA